MLPNPPRDNAPAEFRVSVVIVNYGTADLTIAAVRSVLSAQNAGLWVDVHVLDNASPGSDAARLGDLSETPDWARVTLHLSPENLGFGRGNNAVIRKLAAQDRPPDAVFLLNPDARLATEAIVTLADFVRAHPGVAVAGAQIVKPGVGLVTAAFRFPTPLGEFVSALALGPVSRRFETVLVPMAPGIETQKVDWVAGAAMMVRLQAFEQVKGFDPDYFLYYEEVDLMWRLHRAGWATWFVAEAVVEHEEGAATNVASAQAVRRANPAYWYDSWRLYFTKTGGRGHALRAALARFAGAWFNAVHTGLRGRPPAAPLRFAGDFGRHVLRPLIFGKVVARHE